MIAAQPVLPPCRPGRRHGILSAPILLALALVLTGAPVRGATRPSAETLLEQARAALPSGWSLAAAGTPSLPRGWHSADTTAVTVQVDTGTATRSVTLVPLDWVGVQLKGPAIDPVRRGPTAKVIVPAEALPLVSAWLDAFAPDTASLATAQGTTNAYAGQYGRVEAEVRALLRKGGAAREVATASFIALGVPAEDLIRDAALQARHPARVAAVYSLRHFPGRATREALHRIIADKARDTAADTCRLAAIETCRALMLDTHGPAIAAALQAEKDEVVVVQLAAEINRLRFAGAAPELRRWLKAAVSPETKVACAQALATVRDQAAIDEIRSAIHAPPPRRAAVAPSGDAAARRQLALELHRLTGAWGEPMRGARLSLSIESPDRALVYVENMGLAPLHYVPRASLGDQPWPAGLEVTLDDTTVSPWGTTDTDISRAVAAAQEIAPGTVMCFELRLAQPIPTEGEHVLGASWLGVAANRLLVRSGAVSQAQAEPAS